jgi:hypothetical protein
MAIAIVPAQDAHKSFREGNRHESSCSCAVRLCNRFVRAGPVAIQVQQHGKRLAADVAGKIVKASENNLHVAHVQDFTSADYVMDLDKPVFTDGILRVGYALNDVIVAQVKKDHH